MADGEAVRLGDFVHVIGRDQKTGARHIIDYNGGIAWNVFAHVARDGARVSVVAAAGGSADNDSQSLPLIKTVLRGGRRDPQTEDQKHVSRCFECSASHVFSLD